MKDYCVRAAFCNIRKAAGMRLSAGSCTPNCNCQYCRRQWTADQRLRYQLNHFYMKKQNVIGKSENKKNVNGPRRSDC
jgi:hypothetical protein